MVEEVDSLNTAIFSVTLSCTGDSMTITLNTVDPFQGRLYSQSTGKDCQTKGSAGTITVLTVYFEEKEAARCGVEREVGGAYSVSVVVQHHPVLQRRGDRAVRLYCYFDTGVKVVTNGYDVLAEYVVDDNDSGIKLIISVL